MAITKLVAGPQGDAGNSKGAQIAQSVNDLIENQSGLKTKIVSGVIRNDGTGWKLIDDIYHTGINIDSVSNDDSKITVDYTSIGATKVISFLIGCDETYASLGYSVGSSVANTKAEIYPSKIAGNGCSGLLRYNSAGGGTITAPFGQDFGFTSLTWDSVNKWVVIGHDSVGVNHLAQQPIITPRRTCKPARIEGVTTNETSFYFVDSSGTKTDPVDGDQFFFSRGTDYIKEKMNPNEVNNSTGNFWFIGVMLTE